MTPIPWSAGTWTNRPAAVSAGSASLTATAAEGSDAWRETAYDLVHASEHAQLAPPAVGKAMEVTVSAPWHGQLDQAGLPRAAGRAELGQGRAWSTRTAVSCSGRSSPPDDPIGRRAGR